MLLIGQSLFSNYGSFSSRSDYLASWLMAVRRDVVMISQNGIPIMPLLEAAELLTALKL